MSIDEITLRSQLKRFNKQPFTTDKKQPVGQRLDASSKMERELLYLMLSSNILIPKVLEEICLEEFTNKDFQQIAQKIVELYHKNNVVKGEDVLHILDDTGLNKILIDIVTTEEFQNITDHGNRLEAWIYFFKRRKNKKKKHQKKKKKI